MVSRLIDEWRSGTNRFDRQGEVLYGARIGEQVVGVCGLNVDPFVESQDVGRVRRLYVSTERRREGIGSALLGRVMTQAAGRFDVLHVRTYDRVADSFYRSLGFTAIDGDEHCTHVFELP